MNDRAHWETVYTSRAIDAVSWFQPTAERSLALIRRVLPRLDAPVIDVGGGASVLVDELLRAGCRDLTVLDIAGAALDASRARLHAASATSAAAAAVHWIDADVRTATLPAAHYAVWHDRAVFHFLTDAADRAAYIAQVRHAVRPGGFVVMATFADDGPSKCSGLPVARYSPGLLHQELGPAFAMISNERETHHTPSGATQEFLYCLFQFNDGHRGRPSRHTKDTT